jgi:serine/threonine protein kinase
MNEPRMVGPWVLTEHLGSGGMGSVWLASDDAGRAAAVKLIRSDLRHDPEATRRFQREFDVARRVTTRRVAVPLDADLAGDPSYIAWEYVAGQTLQERVEQVGPLAPDEVVVFARDVAEALRDLEAAGITHRDVKPSNILLGPSSAVLVDLGVSLVEDQTGLTTGGQVIGTPGWLTPEQLEGGRPNSAADVFNWAGAVVFAATARGPFGSDTLPKLMYRVAHEPPDLTGVPASLTGLVQSALSKDPAERPSARQLASQLNDLLNGSPEALPVDEADRTHGVDNRATGTQALETAAVPAAETPTSFAGTQERPRRGGRVIAIAAGVAAAALLALALVLVRMPDNEPVAAEPIEPVDVSSTASSPPEGPSPSETAATNAPVPSANRNDPTSYYSSDGTAPALTPACSGVVGLCLGIPIDRAVERLGTEDYRYDLEDNVSYMWDLGAVTVDAVADAVGSIIELSVGTREGARAATPISGVVVGQTTVRQFADGVDGVDFVDELSGEGFSIVSLGIATGSEGHEARQVSLSLEWDERDWYELSEDGFSIESVLEHLGHRPITDFRVGYEFPESYYEDLHATQTSAEAGDYGDPPVWVHDVLAQTRGGFQMVDGSTWDPYAEINVVTGSMLGGATGRGMYAFFFSRDDGYIGTDALDASNTLSIAWRDDTTIAIEYVLYREGDPGCCATGGSALVRFHWDGNRLNALDEIPPTSGPVYR